MQPDSRDHPRHRIRADASERAGSTLYDDWRSLRDGDPHLWRAIRTELLNGWQWVDRGVVLGYAALLGVVVVGFTLLADAALEGFRHVTGFAPWAPWLALAWTPAMTVLLLWWTRRFAPGAAGSGIPQVVRALDDRMPPPQRAWLVSMTLSLHKIALVSGGMLAGLSIGREGPTVQVGAGIMGHARRWLSSRSVIDTHDLMVAGAAAGVAASFNTPLGGIVFALEQLTRRRDLSHSALVIASIMLAGLVSIAVFGNATYFGRIRVEQLSWALFWPGLLVAVVCGFAGGLFSRLIVASARMLPDRWSRLRAACPLRFAAGCGLAVAVIGLCTDGATAGAGYQATRALLEGQAELPVVYTLLKFCATWISTWSGVPAGVFTPSLSIGAGIGHDIATLAGVGPQDASPLIALGMAGFLAAATSGPITAFIIVMEMVSGNAMVLSLMACALLSSGLARLVTRPMYLELGALLPIPGTPADPAPPAEPQTSAEPRDERR